MFNKHIHLWIKSHFNIGYFYRFGIVAVFDSFALTDTSGPFRRYFMGGSRPVKVLVKEIKSTIISAGVTTVKELNFCLV